MRFVWTASVILPVILTAQTREVNKTIPLTATGAVTLENHKGTIRVTTWDRAEVDIKARISAEDGFRVDRRAFDATEVLVDASSGVVTIRTKYPDTVSFFSDGSNNPAVHYTIQMPRTARLTIQDHRSNIEVSDLRSELSINTHRGTVEVHRLAGPLQLTTHRGEVHADFAAFAGPSRIDTHRGSIELTLPRSSRFDLHTQMDRHAAIDNDFPVTTRTLGGRGANVSGSVNGGGPVLDVKTYRGHIRLRAK